MDWPILHQRQGEVGASQSQKRANSAPEMASPSKLHTGFQFLTKDFLRFWMVDICREGQSQRSAPRRVTRHTARGAPRNRLDGEGRSRTAPEESALVKLLVAELLRPGRHKTQAQPSLRLCGVPENLNLSGLGLGSARNSGPAPCRAAWSLSSVDGESTY